LEEVTMNFRPGRRRIDSFGRREVIFGAAMVGLGAMIGIDTPGSRGGAPPRGPLSDETKLRHLLRRAGFGATSAEIASYRQLGLAGTIDRLVNYESVDNSAVDGRLNGLGLDLTRRPDIGRWWITRMIYTARPLEEKMTLFWHGLLTSAISKIGRPEPMVAQNEFFRANAVARFPDILKGVSMDPAMMLWLDTATNRKGHPNENYARELMELFSLGIGNYTELDVREAARAFTGWSLTGQPKLGNVKFRFAPGQHDSGSKTFLGKTGNFDGNDIVDKLVTQPVSARFVAGKLFAFFAYPNPTAAVLDPLVEAYQSNNYSIRALVQAVLSSDAFYSPTGYRAMIKSPVDYLVGAARALGIETDAKGVPTVLARMGQELFNPPNVAGWPGGPSWLTSGTWLARLNLANALVGGVGGGPNGAGGRSVAAGSGVDTLLASATSPTDLVDRLADTLLDGEIELEQRQILIDYLTQPGHGDRTAVDPTWLDERRRGVLYLMLAMPEYHLG
jgi:hypothetical protein